MDGHALDVSGLAAGPGHLVGADLVHVRRSTAAGFLLSDRTRWQNAAACTFRALFRSGASGVLQILRRAPFGSPSGIPFLPGTRLTIAY